MLMPLEKCRSAGGNKQSQVTLTTLTPRYVRTLPMVGARTLPTAHQRAAIAAFLAKVLVQQGTLIREELHLQKKRKRKSSMYRVVTTRPLA